MRSYLRRRALVAVAATTALVAAGIAIADPGPGTTTLVSAAFSANTVGPSQSQACTGANSNAYTVTDASYTGTASSADSRLAGPLTISVESVYDSTTNVGSLTGDVEIDGTAANQPSHFRAALTAVDVNGTVQGYLIGEADSGVRFMGSFSSGFSPTGGFGSASSPGTIGSGTATNTAIITGGSCTATTTTPPPGPPHLPFLFKHGDGDNGLFKGLGRGPHRHHQD
jgi:hypothetical protein